MSLSWTSDVTDDISPRFFYNEKVIAWLAVDWRVDLVRAAMGVSDHGGSFNGPHLAPGVPYITNPTQHKNYVHAVVRAAIWQGIYVIIDWHSHQAALASGGAYPQGERPAAIEFFSEMANMYKDYPNIIYEIYNEPLQNHNWDMIRNNYANAVANAIRAIDPNNIIIVGTPSFSANVQDVTTMMTQPHIAYAFHFYCNHNFSDRIASSASRNLPIFVSEFGLSNYDGDGNCGSMTTGSGASETFNPSYMSTWFSAMDQHSVSWANWAISNRDEQAAALRAPNRGGRHANLLSQGNWTNSDLTSSGIAMRTRLRSNKNPSAANRTFRANITAVGPGTVSGGQNIAVCAQGTVTATPNTGSRLEGWIINGQTVPATTNPYTAEFCYDRTGQAVFFQNNMITVGGSTFTTGTTGWTGANTSPAGAVTLEAVNGEMRVTMPTNAGSAPADVRVQHQNLSVTANRYYKLTFRARTASGTRTITPTFRGGSSLNASFVDAPPVTLTATMPAQPFEVRFSATGTATSAILAFSCGGNTGAWFLDDVSLVEDGVMSVVPQVAATRPFSAAFNGHALVLSGGGRVADIAVYDMSGRVRLSEKAMLSDVGTRVSLSRLPAGVYTVRYKVDGKTLGTNEKIVLAR